MRCHCACAESDTAAVASLLANSSRGQARPRPGMNNDSALSVGNSKRLFSVQSTINNANANIIVFFLRFSIFLYTFVIVVAALTVAPFPPNVVLR